jgi:chromosome segregation ATPase
MSNQHESEIDTLSFSHHPTKSSQSLSSITENDSQITSNSLSDIQKEFNRISPIDLSSLTNSDQLSSIHYIDSSSSSEILNSLNRKISLSETDLLASIHRNINKQLLDNQSDDDILFLEWDKERNLFQDYINSLRKEIRVLLQERLEHQTQSKDKNDEQMKIDLLQKSLEEKNFVFEQLQTEYELTKDKNTNLIRKMSHLQTDAKSQTGIIDELKQKLTDLNVDLQNHLLVKRRLETSIINLENDCKILDTERLRLTNDIKENQHNKQDSEKLLQKANVQIAEQGKEFRYFQSFCYSNFRFNYRNASFGKRSSSFSIIHHSTSNVSRKTTNYGLFTSN